VLYPIVELLIAEDVPVDIQERPRRIVIDGSAPSRPDGPVVGFMHQLPILPVERRAAVAERNAEASGSLILVY
jgi:hypothetical protein